MLVPIDYVNNNMRRTSRSRRRTSNWYTFAQVSALTIKVQTGRALVGGARVAISGGLTAPGVYIAGTTGTSGASTGLFTVMVPSGSGYTLTAWPATSAPAHRAEITHHGHEDDYRLMTRRTPVARPSNHDGFTVIELVISMVLISRVPDLLGHDELDDPQQHRGAGGLGAQGEVRATVDAFARTCARPTPATARRRSRR
jgi:hypothetical protein